MATRPARCAARPGGCLTCEVAHAMAPWRHRGHWSRWTRSREIHVSLASRRDLGDDHTVVITRLVWASPRGRLRRARSEEPTSELQSLMRNSYAVSCLKK